MIYLDNAATTSLDSSLIDIFSQYSKTLFYNPNALYKPAVDVLNLINTTKGNIVDSFNLANYNVLFTSSASMANNIAILNTVKKKGSTLLFSSVEHSSVYELTKVLKSRGHIVKFIKCDNFGKVLIDDLINKLDENVEMVSIMHVCNQTGSINDINQIATVIKNFNSNILFHSDGVQAYLKIPTKLSRLIDLYTISAHKIHGPKGIGALIYNPSINIKKFIYGGDQESGIVSGTYNVPYIAMINELISKYNKNILPRYNNAIKIQEQIINETKKRKYLTALFSEETSPYIYSLLLKNLKGETALHALSSLNIYISTGSACSSNIVDSRISDSLSIKKDLSTNVIRISISKDTTSDEINIFFTSLDNIYSKYCI